MILVAVRDAPQREALRAALHREGWQVSLVGSLDSAYRMAADQAPQLVVLDAELPGSEELVQLFSRGNGGPGILLLADPATWDRFQAADAVVGRQVEGDELVASVRLCLAAPRPVASAPAETIGHRRWTAEELFGEILDDLDAAVSAVEAAAPAGLEETPEALARGTVPAETLVAPLIRQPPSAEPLPFSPDAAGEAVEGLADEVVEGLAQEDVEVVTGPPEPELDLAAAPVAEPALAEPAAIAVADEGAPGAEPGPTSTAGPTPGVEEVTPLGSSALDLALAGAGGQRAPSELESLAEELLGIARAHPPEPPEAPAAEVSSEPAVEPVEAEPGVPSLSPEPPAPASVEPRVGAYRLVERLAASEAGEIWRATRESIADETPEVTVQVSRGLAGRRPDLAARALAAAERAALLDHPAVLPPLDAGLAGDDFYLVTESVSATTLESVLASVRALDVRIPLGLALGMGERVAAALEHAHGVGSDGAVHGALQPGHVLLTRDGEIRVTGFAVASVLESEQAASAARLRYRAPEQLGGESPDSRGDLYSFGALLFEMVTGRPAFGGEDAAAVAHAVQHDAPDPPDRLDPTIPAEVSGLISRLLKRRRDERVQGAGEAQRKLDLALQALPAPPGAAELAAWIRQLEEAMRHARPRRPVAEERPAEPPAPVAEWPVPAPEAPPRAGTQRRRWLIAALLAAGLALGAVAYWVGRDRGRRVITVPPPAPRPGAAMSTGSPSPEVELDQGDQEILVEPAAAEPSGPAEATTPPPPAASEERPPTAGGAGPPAGD